MSKADTRSIVMRSPRLLVMSRQEAMERCDWLVSSFSISCIRRDELRSINLSRHVAIDASSPCDFQGSPLVAAVHASGFASSARLVMQGSKGPGELNHCRYGSPNILPSESFYKEVDPNAGG